MRAPISYASLADKMRQDNSTKPEIKVEPVVDKVEDNETEYEFDYLVCLDFEATCDDKPMKDGKMYPNEIIEFPSVVVCMKTLKIVDRIEQFVKPVKNTQLTKFCKDLTTITQEQVDGGISLEEALKAHQKFVSKYPNSVIVTCGDWDCNIALKNNCWNLWINYPNYYKRWINIKQPFENLYKVKGRSSMAGMTKYLGIKFVGTAHRGIDDSYNLAVVALRMLKDGWYPEITRSIK